MRRIEQPGPPVAERIQCVEARGRAFSFTMQAGVPLLEAVRRGFADAGFAGGVLNFKGGALGPFAYVMPALSKTPEHAAFYSDTFRPQGVTRLKMGAMTLASATARRSSIAMRCGPKPTAAPMAGTFSRRKPSSPNRSRPTPSASTARSSSPSPIPRPTSSCSGRSRANARRQRARAAPLRCGCGRTRISPAASKRSAGSAASARRACAAASAASSARALRMDLLWCRSRPSLRSARA